jgi:hypothetical protein
MPLFLSRRLVPAVLAAAVLGAAACNNDSGAVTEPAGTRMYNQVQRLGNPLVSEVFLAKRSHPQHASIGPAEDATMIGPELKRFVLDVAGRKQTVANTLAAVLLPDMLVVQTDKSPATSGWLGWALADGWGGRNLTDDVVDAGLSALFGSLLDSDNVSPGLTTDNVANDSPFLTTFPYLASPN